LPKKDLEGERIGPIQTGHQLGDRKWKQASSWQGGVGGGQGRTPGEEDRLEQVEPWGREKGSVEELSGS
jgi:hypothetical protein